MKTPLKIAVLQGGPSSEREVSLNSGKNVIKAIKALGHTPIPVDPTGPESFKNLNIDLAFIALHGKYGEDGTVQSQLDAQEIPYIGSNAATSKHAFNKLKTKETIQSLGFKTPHTSQFPQILKPIAEGSSINMEIFDTPEALKQKLKELGPDSQNYFTETHITGKEITVSIIEINKVPTALPILELRPKPNYKFYDYDAKYTPGATDFILPAELPAELTQTCQSQALALHNALNCKDFSRVDMIIDQNNTPQILEINTIPGLTNTSDLPASAKAHGLTFKNVIEIIIKNHID